MAHFQGRTVSFGGGYSWRHSLSSDPTGERLHSFRVGSPRILSPMSMKWRNIPGVIKLPHIEGIKQCRHMVILGESCPSRCIFWVGNIMTQVFELSFNQATKHLSLKGPQTPPARHLPDYLGVWSKFPGLLWILQKSCEKTQFEGTVVYRFIPLFTVVSYIFLVVGLGISGCHQQYQQYVNLQVSQLVYQPWNFHPPTLVDQERSQSPPMVGCKVASGGDGFGAGKVLEKFPFRFPMPNGFRGQVFRTWL